MFKRIIVEEWHIIVPYISFGLTAVAFVFFVIRALFMKKEEAERLSTLPLQDQHTDHE